MSLIFRLLAAIIDYKQAQLTQPQSQLNVDMQDIAEADEREAREVLIEALTLQRDALRAKALAQPAPRNAEEMLVKAAKIDMKIREEIRKQW